VGVLNIHSLVPVTLDLASNNYSKWRRLLLVVLNKYALADHVLSDEPRMDRPSWVSMESTVLTWLYGTVSAGLLKDIMSFDSARSAWLFLEDQFLGNKESRALHLEATFRKLSQGDFTILEFSRCLRTMADDLAALDDPLTDRQLALAFLRGLSDRFVHTVPLIRQQRPFPAFDEIRSILLLEEISLDDRKQNPTALIAATGSQPPSAGSQSPSGAKGTSGGNNNNKNRRRGKGNQGGGNQGGSNSGGNGGGSNGGTGGAPQGSGAPSWSTP